MKINIDKSVQEADYSEIDKAWKDIKRPIELFLLARVKTIQKQYEGQLSDEQMAKVIREEKFVGECSDFLNDTESYTLLYQEMIKVLKEKLSIEKERTCQAYQDLGNQIQENIAMAEALHQLGQPGYKEHANVLRAQNDRNKKAVTVR